MKFLDILNVLFEWLTKCYDEKYNKTQNGDNFQVISVKKWGIKKWNELSIKNFKRNAPHTPPSLVHFRGNFSWMRYKKNFKNGNKKSVPKAIKAIE